jgi:hypothetical protein
MMNDDIDESAEAVLAGKSAVICHRCKNYNKAINYLGPWCSKGHKLKNTIYKKTFQCLEYEEKPELNDAVNHPPHYGGKNDPYEVIKILRAKLTPEEYKGFLRANVLKYVFRAEQKNGLEDYRKALFYMEELVAHEQQKNESQKNDES